MAPEEDLPKDEKNIQTLEEICQNTRAIRSDVREILDLLREYDNPHDGRETDNMTWQDLYADDNDSYQ